MKSEFPIINDLFSVCNNSPVSDYGDYLHKLTMDQLERLTHSIFHYKVALEEDKGLQQLILFYSQMSIIETGKTTVEMNSEQDWYSQMSFLAFLEKLRRLGIMKDYKGFISNSEIEILGLNSSADLEKILKDHGVSYHNSKI